MTQYTITEFDINSPLYKNETYKRLEPVWSFLKDMYAGRRAWVDPAYGISDTAKASAYLPKHTDESITDWKARVRRSFFPRKFAEVIDESAAYLSRFYTVDLHPSLEEKLSNIDNKGNSLKVFLAEADRLALRDEHCFVYIDFPTLPLDADGNPLIKNAKQERELDRSPYLVLIEASNVINWRVERTRSGQEYLTMVVIQECVEEYKGDYGSETRIQYRVIYPDRYEVYGTTDNNVYDYFLIEQGETSLGVIPIVPYSVTDDSDFFGGTPPLIDIAELNLELYLKKSQYDEILLKCNMPVYVVNELVPRQPRPNANGEPSQPPSISIGPNTVLFNVEGSVLEPTGRAIDQTRLSIENIEKQIKEKSLAFKHGTSPLTATEVNRISVSDGANLVRMAAAKESSVRRIFDYWMLWIGSSDDPGFIQIDKSLLSSPISEGNATFLFELRKSGELSRSSLFEILKSGKILPEEFDIDEELDNLERETGGLDVQERLAKIFDVLLSHQVIDADEAAKAIAENRPIAEVIDLVRRREERDSIQRLPEGFSDT